jgi:hypothetical protein
MVKHPKINVYVPNGFKSNILYYIQKLISNNCIFGSEDRMEFGVDFIPSSL